MRDIPTTAAKGANALFDEVTWIDDQAKDSHDRIVAQLRERHWTMLIVSVLVIIASFSLHRNPTGQIVASWLPLESLPPMCGSRAMFGIECPGCGLTRSFVALAHGDLAESIRLHRVGWVLAAAVVLQIPYRIYALRELRTKASQRTWPTWFGNGLIATLILNWLAQVVMAS